ncbi:hypothetical protein EV385_0781 [Krasilnikovia cinnamomea]|uniref:VOC domain-containing protein n=1 Tax=Krasilnikovia cinnamomea TaxID=349313 RepID=A0A4Q7ZED3_9ACTN|nr:VOC family protein [Krasilnikovia cinnamomea]RZU49047.1 hypothetical protein EV385_0781 [Krasilnikovia cinnamomea]
MRIRGFAPASPCWVELASADPARAADFYAALFGWEPAGHRFRLDGRVVAGLTRAGADRPAGWLAYLNEPDLDAALDRVLRAGGHCVSAPAAAHGGWSTIVADAEGATLGLWQAGDFAGIEVGGEPGAMTWPELLTHDAQTALDFYGRAFGWLLRDEPGSARTRGEWLTRGHDAIAGLAPGDGWTRWRSAFQVADCARAIERCQALGGRVVAGPVQMGVGRYAELVDPWGSRFAVAAPVGVPVELGMSFGSPTGVELTFPG